MCTGVFCQVRYLDNHLFLLYNTRAVKQEGFTEALVEDLIETGWLFDFYGPLLTERQRALLTLWCWEDLSISEIAAREGISRHGVSDAVLGAKRRLETLEAQLGLLARYRRITEGLTEALEDVKHIPGEEARRVEARLKLLLAEEEEDDGL